MSAMFGMPQAVVAWAVFAGSAAAFSVVQMRWHNKADLVGPPQAASEVSAATRNGTMSVWGSESSAAKISGVDPHHGRVAYLEHFKEDYTWKAAAAIVASPFVINGGVVDLPEIVSHHAAQAFGTGGYLEFAVTCTSQVGTLELDAFISTPDGASDSFHLEVDGSNLGIWHLGLRQWDWSAVSPSFALSAGLHAIKLWERQDGLEIKLLRFRNHNGDCEFVDPKAPSTCAQPGTCSIYEDPHIKVFDGMQISLLGTETSTMADFGSGDMWLVRSSDISIQARYLPDPNLSSDNQFVRAVAVGGPFLSGNTLIIGPLDEEIAWNGAPILESQTSDFEVEAGHGVVRAKRSSDSRLVENMTQANPGVDVDLPLGVKLTVNRLKKHVNIFIEMPPAAGGQDGLCGNFNCNPFDDGLNMIFAGRDPQVRLGYSLFPSD